MQHVYFVRRTARDGTLTHQQLKGSDAESVNRELMELAHQYMNTLTYRRRSVITMSSFTDGTLVFGLDGRETETWYVYAEPVKASPDA